MWVLSLIDSILFIVVAVSVGYLFVFAFFSLWNPREKYPRARKKYRFVVLVPAYKEDRVIERTVASLLVQDYPEGYLDVVVISDRMSDAVNERLAQQPVTLLKPVFEQSSKARALNFAIDYLEEGAAGKERGYDVAVILDSDNLVDPHFIRDMADAYDMDMKAIQAHRIAKNRNTSTAVLDAVSEEINNSIFRKGHVNMGLSSALIGSGMAFDYKWFVRNIKLVSTAGEDKELEVLLLKQGIFIDYLNDTFVYDEKVAQPAVFYKQRRRWLAAQFGVLFNSVKGLPGALFSGNIDYADKLFQWMMLPRVLLAGLCGMMSVFVPFVALGWAVKWWILLLVLLFTLSFAIPDYLVDRSFKKAISHAPLLGIMMFINLFRLRGVNKKFIHTEKRVA